MIYFDIFNLEDELSKLESKTTELNFWEDSQNSSNILKKINEIKTKIGNYKSVNSDLQNLIDLTELLEQENDIELEKELQKGITILQNNIEKLEISTLLSGKYDKNNAIVTIHPGAGGTEAQDWAEMLYRMYTRWAIANNYEVKELDYLNGE